MIAFFRCLCRSEHKLRAAELKRQGVEIRLTRNNPEWRKQAESYKLPLPFIVENGQAKAL